MYHATSLDAEQLARQTYLLLPHRQRIILPQENPQHHARVEVRAQNRSSRTSSSVASTLPASAGLILRPNVDQSNIGRSGGMMTTSSNSSSTKGGPNKATGVSRSHTRICSPRCAARRYSLRWAFSSEIFTRLMT